MFPTNSSLYDLECCINQLTNISGILANVDLEPNNFVDIRWNNLDCEDWPDILAMQKRIGVGLFYIPQNSIDLFECNINTSTNFPDPNFRIAIENFMDIAHEGIITAGEAAEKKGDLICANQNISNMTGLDFFLSIDGLNCNDNLLTSLDISGATIITHLDCNNNLLLSLDISNASDLIHLDCSWNQLTSLDVSDATGLDELLCNNNLIADISSLATQTGLEFGDVIDVRYNNLDCSDWDAIAALQNRGVNVDYSPQNSMDPFDCSAVVNINTAVNFPDPKFRSSVENFMGVAPGGAFTAVEAAAKMGTLDCSNQNIADLTGIEYFTDLEQLYCYSNQLTSLDLSYNTALEKLFCSHNQLTFLHVSTAAALIHLDCRDNQLTSLDISSNTVLEYLDCANNLLTGFECVKQ